MASKIKTCTCKHPMQDKMHGQGRRVFNQTKKSDYKIWRCTVCKNEKE